MITVSEAASGAAGSKSTSPAKSRTEKVGLWPKDESMPSANAWTVNRPTLESNW